MSKLSPVAIFPRPSSGKSIFYEKHQIAINDQGCLEIDGKVHQDNCVQFTRTYGVGCSSNCIVCLRYNQIEIYEGGTIGPSMLTREAVLAKIG